MSSKSVLACLLSSCLRAWSTRHGVSAAAWVISYVVLWQGGMAVAIDMHGD